MNLDPYDLQRFAAAQERVYDEVRRELAAGEKRSHWMWFVFPQIAGLGSSATAARYALGSLEEAVAYWTHPVLGPRLRECTTLVNAVQGRAIERIFGYPDYLKFRSSMTLFAAAAPNEPSFSAALAKYFDGEPDPLTLARLRPPSPRLSSAPHARYLGATEELTMNPIVVYRHALSGHAHRVELFVSLLGLPMRLVDVDLAAGAQKKPEFLKMNPFGQVPVIEDGEVTLADSNAILVYLALRYDPSGAWYPREPLAAARVQQWLSVAAGQLAGGPAMARFIKVFGAPLDYERPAALAAQLFGVLDAALAREAFLAGPSPTIADVAMYTYTAHAPEGGVSLEPHRNIRAWIARIEALPRFVAMPRAGSR